MKILYSMIYAPEKGGSGAPIYTYHLLKGMSQKGEKPGVLFSVSRTYKNVNRTFYTSIPIFFDKAPIFDNQPKVPNSIPFKDMGKSQIEEYIQKLYEGFKKAILEERYNLIHVQHGMYIGYVVSLIKKELGIPYVVTLHIMELNFLNEFPDPILAMVAMIDADRIIALTEAQKRRFLQTYSKENIIKLEAKRSGKASYDVEKRYQWFIGNKVINPDKIQVCSLGIDTQLFNINQDDEVPHQLKKLKIPNDKQIVLYAGRLIEMKGIRHLMNAEPIYNRSGKIHTIILGGGELAEFVKETCKKRAYIHYLGFKEQDEMPLYYNFAAAHNGVFSVPSSSEGLSLAYLEAMACGLRVVACCREDMGDLDFMQEPFATFANFNDSDDLAEKITLMLKEKEIPREKIRSKVEQYNSQNMINEVFSLYLSILTHT
jgi:glycosyltransferase involved in cell wall biosynthesis